MKRKFAVLTTLGALIAFAIPASSMASMYPAGHNFEITGNSSGPKISTSLGNCLITKITGQIPAAPKNEESGNIVPVLTAGTCSPGTSMTLGSSWTFGAYGYLAGLGSGPEGIVLRFTSLPGCKLTNSGAIGLFGIWSNGTTTPTLLKSGFHPHNKQTLTWFNDGGSCALAGKSETIDWEAGNTYPSNSMTVTDLTSPTTPIIVGNNK